MSEIDQASSLRKGEEFDTLPPTIRNAVSREEILAYYEELSGRSIDYMDFY